MFEANHGKVIPVVLEDNDSNSKSRIIHTKVELKGLNKEEFENLASTVLNFIVDNDLKDYKLYHILEIVSLENAVGTNIGELNLAARTSEIVKEYLNVFELNYAVIDNTMVAFAANILRSILKALLGKEFPISKTYDVALANIEKKINE